MPKHYKNARGNKKGSYQGSVEGPNAPNISSSKKGGNNNSHQTVETAKASYKKARGG
jgi:hypothetical protein